MTTLKENKPGKGGRGEGGRERGGRGVSVHCLVAHTGMCASVCVRCKGVIISVRVF